MQLDGKPRCLFEEFGVLLKVKSQVGEKLDLVTFDLLEHLIAGCVVTESQHKHFDLGVETMQVRILSKV